MSQEFMTLKEVMERLQIARPTIYKYVKQGKLTLYHSGVGKRAMFLKEEVEHLDQITLADPKESRAAA